MRSLSGADKAPELRERSGWRLRLGPGGMLGGGCRLGVGRGKATKGVQVT